MGNPLMNMLGQGIGNNSGNVARVMKDFNKFRSMFAKDANPQTILNDMMKNGKVSRSQVDQAVNMAKQMGLIK